MRGGWGLLMLARFASWTRWPAPLLGTAADQQRLPARSLARRYARSRLQLSFELVEEAPIGVFRDDLLRRFFDCAVFAQAQRIKPDRVLGIVVTPAIVRKVLQ